MDALYTFGFAAVAGLGAWFLRGRFTPAKRSERYDLADKMLDVRQKLSAAGFDGLQIEQFVATLESDKTGERASSMLRAVGLTPDTLSTSSGDVAGPSILHTTAAMGARAEARLGVLDARIEKVLLDIEILTGHAFAQGGLDPKMYDPNHVRKMHRAWKMFRVRAGASASEDYAGGSISGVIWNAEEVRIAEGFLKDIRKRLADLKS